MSVEADMEHKASEPDPLVHMEKASFVV